MLKKKKRLKFTDRKHSRQGILSSCLGAGAFLVLAGIFAAAYIQRGQAGKIIAVLGFLAFLLACAGLGYGILGMKEEEVYRLFPYLGCGLNGILLAGFVLIYALGW